MEGIQKKFGNGQGLPPIPLPSSFSRKNTGDDAGKEAKATAEPETEDRELEAKKLRRVLASRQYSQKYRLKQLHYIMQLETEVKALQAEVAIMSPRIKYADCQNSLLRAENGSMKQKLSAFSGELTFKEAQYEELKRERQILKQLCIMYNQQQEQPKLVNNLNQRFNKM
ncbi:hypothetical protein WN944_028279 [Citrus x changshan-huyou]|uniref:BZIP domain-containing protein n=2 Tax=Citrus TaxID=2706 RepID=A0A067FU32_CITSI|nr:hypothetical protein KPL70_024707 [Citrus sinensis]KDO66967.1 hypothetical protein CISIN_1g035677mg [Citrus sinensis]GAY37812.1 hypothetical protein CUMW_031870 [Citrus unshiu]